MSFKNILIATAVFATLITFIFATPLPFNSGSASAEGTAGNVAFSNPSTYTNPDDASYSFNPNDSGVNNPERNANSPPWTSTNPEDTSDSLSRNGINNPGVENPDGGIAFTNPM